MDTDRYCQFISGVDIYIMHKNSGAVIYVKPDYDSYFKTPMWRCLTKCVNGAPASPGKLTFEELFSVQIFTDWVIVLTFSRDGQRPGISIGSICWWQRLGFMHISSTCDNCFLVGGHTWLRK